jgi:hypothetical protein
MRKNELLVLLYKVRSIVGKHVQHHNCTVGVTGEEIAFVCHSSLDISALPCKGKARAMCVHEEDSAIRIWVARECNAGVFEDSSEDACRAQWMGKKSGLGNETRLLMVKSFVASIVMASSFRKRLDIPGSSTSAFNVRQCAEPHVKRNVHSL